jgi:GTPase SAR1 family protein
MLIIGDDLLFNSVPIMDLMMFIFLVGNKNDTPDRKVVITEDAQRFADSMGIPLYETSAKDNINVEEMFLQVTKMVHNLTYVATPL